MSSKDKKIVINTDSLSHKKANGKDTILRWGQNLSNYQNYFSWSFLACTSNLRDCQRSKSVFKFESSGACGRECFGLMLE